MLRTVGLYDNLLLLGHTIQQAAFKIELSSTPQTHYTIYGDVKGEEQSFMASLVLWLNIKQVPDHAV